MFPAWTWIVGFWIGAAIGSFLNVVIYRMPRGISLGKPTYSYCPSSNERLTAIDLVPILSYVFLRGRSRHDGSKIPIRYLWVEVITGALWAAIWYRNLVQGNDWTQAIAFSLFASALVAAIYIDLQYYIIPDQINAFMLLVGLALNGARFATGDERAWMWGMPSSIAGWLVGFGVLWGITLLGRLAFGKDAMGHGDIKMARGIGAVLLPALALWSFALAVALGALFGIVQVLLRSRLGASQEQEDDETWEPESVGSIFKCGLGYLFAIDIIGLFWTSLYEKWFGENPYAVEEVEEEPKVELTMIPFGPYLAAGAIIAMLFPSELQSLFASYWNSMTGT